MADSRTPLPKKTEHRPSNVLSCHKHMERAQQQMAVAREMIRTAREMCNNAAEMRAQARLML